MKIKFSSSYLEIFSRHTLWLTLCSLVLRFLTVQSLPFHSILVRSDFRRGHSFLRETFLAPFKIKLTLTLDIFGVYGSYTIMAKPIKSLEFHVFLIKIINKFNCFSLGDNDYDNLCN